MTMRTILLRDRLNATIVVVLISFSLTFQATADNTTTKAETDTRNSSAPTFSEPIAAAQYGLSVLKQIRLPLESQTDLFFRTLGFNSVEELESAQIGSSLHVYEVSKPQLVSFPKDGDPENILRDSDTHHLLFPLLVKGEARSILTVTQIEPDKRWRVVSRGRPKLARLIQQHGQSSANLLISISELGLEVLGSRRGDQMLVIPMEDISTLKEHAVAGQPMPASELFFMLGQSWKRLSESKQADVPKP